LQLSYEQDILDIDFTCLMVHINISHLDYSEAFSALMATIREPGDIICRIDFDADHRHSKVIRDFV
jgi:hypothetical protein